MLTLEQVHVDVDELKHVDTSLLYDVRNIEIRSKIERELSKILESIKLYRNGKSYIIDIKYRNVDQFKYVLMVEANKVPVLVSAIDIERTGNTVVYRTPSFALSVEDGLMPRFHFAEDEPLSMTDYAMLQNYIGHEEGEDAVAIWMRHNFTFLFS